MFLALESRDSVLLIFVPLVFSMMLGDSRYLLSVLVNLGCHNRMSQTKWFKQQKCVSHSSSRWEVQDQGGFHSEASFLGLSVVGISLCTHMTFSFVVTDREKEQAL